jgi:hypothetical protein
MADGAPDENRPVVAEAIAETALLASISAIPGVGGPLAVIAERVIGELRRERVVDVAESAFAVTSPEHLVRQLEQNDRLADIFVRATESAMRSSHQAKRRAMGRVVAEAAQDSARIDVAELTIVALSELEAPHFRLLADLEASAGHYGEALAVSRRYPAPVPAALQRVGAAMNITYDGGQAAEDDGLPSPVLSSLTEFGRELLGYVRDSESELDG